MSHVLNMGLSTQDANVICETYEAYLAKYNIQCDDAYQPAEEQFQKQINKFSHLLLARLAASAAHAVTAEQPHMMDDRPLEPVE